MTRSFEEPDPPEASRLAPVIKPAPMRLYVCVTCRGANPDPGAEGPRPGAALLKRLREEPADPAIAIVPVECLSVCKRSCAVSFAAPGKWTYVYGDLPAENAAATILRGARLYAEAPDGLIPWKQRPDALKTGVVARVPPMPRGTP
jgi:predicted metal-binding protein